jgi:hypothetical protein
LALAAVLLVALASCSIPLDESPQALDVDEQRDLIFGTTTSTIPQTEELAPYRLFYALETGFQSVSREYAVQPNLSLLLDDLATQPTDEEVEAFAELGTLRSLVPASLNASVSEREGDEQSPLAIVTVDGEGGLPELLQAGESGAALAVGQIVCTVIENNTEIESVEIQAPNEDGEFERLRLFDRDLQTIEGPATAADFDDCRTISEASAEAEADAANTTTTAATSS